MVGSIGVGERPQTAVCCPAHVPATQASAVVQASPSLHVVPFATGGLEQIPVVASHEPALWHWSRAVHVTGFDPKQAPD